MQAIHLWILMCLLAYTVSLYYLNYMYTEAAEMTLIVGKYSLQI